MPKPSNHFYEFSVFRLNPAERTLFSRADGRIIPLTPKAFDTLLALVESRGHVITKEELLERVWPNSFVEENNLAQNISTLRKVFGECAAGERFIETVTKRGYRFVAEVKEVQNQIHIEQPAAFSTAVGVAETYPYAALPPLHYRRAADGNSGGAAHEVSKENAPTLIATVVEQLAPPVVSQSSLTIWVVAVLIALSTAGLIGYYIASRPDAVRVDSERRTLAILPFRNLRPDNESDFLSFSLADAIVSKLNNASALTVRPSSYVEKYRHQLIDPVAVAGELNVNTLLSGSFIKEGDDLRITAQLFDVRSKEILWHDAIDIKYDKLLTLQDRVSQQILTGLAVNLSASEERRFDLDTPRDSLAYEYYLRGVDRYASGEYALAIEMFNQSLAIDPEYALAWAHLGTSYNASASMQFGGRDHYQKAQQAYEKALTINPELIEARTFTANSLTDTGRAEQAVDMLRKGLQTNPNHALAHWEMGYAYRFAGMLAESIAECERARAIDPQVKLTSSALNSYLYVGDYHRFLQSLPIRDDSAFLLFYRGLGHYYLKDCEQAAAYFDRAYELDAEMLQTQIGKALSYACKREERKGVELLRVVEAKAIASGVSDAEAIYKIAQAQSVLGEKDAALRVLRRTIDGGFFCYPYFVNDPLLDNLRGDSRYDALLEQARRRHENFKRRFFAAS